MQWGWRWAPLDSGLLLGSFSRMRTKSHQGQKGGCGGRRVLSMTSTRLSSLAAACAVRKMATLSSAPASKIYGLPLPNFGTPLIAQHIARHDGRASVSHAVLGPAAHKEAAAVPRQSISAQRRSIAAHIARQQGCARDAKWS